MKTWIPREIDVEGINVEIREADATLEVEYVWDCGATDADGRQCSPAGWMLGTVYVASININGRERSREWLCDVCGADAVEATEEWLRDNLDARQIADDEAQAYADAKADYAAE